MNFYFFSFQTFKKKPDHFPFFFKCILKAALAETDGEFSLHEQTVLLLFLDHCFNSLVIFLYLSGELSGFLVLVRGM